MDFKDTAGVNEQTNIPNARCSQFVKEKTSPRHKLKYKLALLTANDSE
jgi:hypothetical protein